MTDSTSSPSAQALSPPITVAIVEDHPDFRDALCDALGQSSHVRVLEACKDLPAGLRWLEQHRPDVLLVDLGLPSGSGQVLIREAQRRWGKLCTSAVLTVSGNEEHLMTAVQAGAKGYLFKSDHASDWLQAVQIMSQGHSPLHAGLACSFLQVADDGQSTAAACDALVHRVSHAYSAQPVNPVKFLVNGVVKKTASFAVGVASSGIQVNPIAFQNINSGMATFQTGLVAYIPVSASYNRATVAGLGISGVANLLDTGSANTLQVQNAGGAVTGDVIPFSGTLAVGAVPAGTAYTVKLYKVDTLVSTQTMVIAGAVLSPSELTADRFPSLTLSSYAGLCPGGANTTATFYSFPASLTASPQSRLQCTSTSVMAEVEAGDSLGRRFDTVYSLNLGASGPSSVLGSPTAGLLTIKAQSVNGTGDAVDTVQWTANNFSAAITVFASFEDPALYTNGHDFLFISGNLYTGVGNSVSSPLNWIPMTYAMPSGGTSVWAVAVDESNRAHWGYVKLR